MNSCSGDRNMFVSWQVTGHCHRESQQTACPRLPTAGKTQEITQRLQEGPTVTRAVPLSISIPRSASLPWQTNTDALLFFSFQCGSGVTSAECECTDARGQPEAAPLQLLLSHFQVQQETALSQMLGEEQLCYNTFPIDRGCVWAGG